MKGPSTPPVEASTLTSVQPMGKPGGRALLPLLRGAAERGAAAATALPAPVTGTMRQPCVVLELQKSVWIWTEQGTRCKK